MKKVEPRARKAKPPATLEAGRGRSASSTESAVELAAANQALQEANELLRAAVRRLEERHRAHEVFLEVSRDMLLARSEADAVELVGQAVRRLLPGRRFCLRVIDPRTQALTSTFWDGAQLPHEPEILRFKEAAFVKMGLPEELRRSPLVEIRPEYVPVFEGTRDGLAMPLVAAGRLHGLLNLEYPPGLVPRRVEDGLLLRPLVNQASLVLRKLGLLQETLYLKEYLEKLVENANALIVVLDPSHDVRVFNRELVRLTGFCKEEVVGRAFLELLPPEERHRFVRVLINSLRGEPTSSFETRIRGKDGTELKVAMNAAPLLTPTGDVEGIIVVGQDLTKIKDLEQQVIHAEKLATLGQLAAGVVHEVNTPLTSITVYADYLHKKLVAEGRDAGDVEKLRRILDGAERIRHFTRDLTVYARPAGSDLVLLSVNDVVRQSASFCEHVVDAACAKVSLALDPAVPRVYGIAGQLQQVFINLLTNACDAVAEVGGGHIEITSARVGDEVVVSVRDHGAGLRAGDVARIFEPFFTTKPPGKGTGLGLSIVRKIVDSHGGRVAVERGDDEGAIFRVELPAERRPPFLEPGA